MTKPSTSLTSQSPFIEGTNIQYAWDSTSLTSLLACPQQYKLRIIEGWQPKDPNVAVALVFGILVHAGIEEWHRAQAAGLDHDAACHQALQHILRKDDFRQPGVPLINQLPTDDDIEQSKSEAAEDDDGIDLRNSKVRTRYHLLRTLTWYFEQYRNDAMPPIQLASGVPAVEYSFRIPVGLELSDGTELLLAGHLDKVVQFNEQKFVTDIKTTKSLTSSWAAQFDLSHQMTGYTLGGKVALNEPIAGVVIDGIALQIGGVKFARYFTYRTNSQLAEYIKLLAYVGEMAERFANDNYYPLNTASCMFCEFKRHCSQPPELRQGYLNQFYKRSEAWNPLKSR